MSYACILLVPLLLTLSLFWGAERILFTKIASMNRTILAHMRQTVDAAFSATYGIALQVELSQELGDALRIEDTLSQEDHYAFLLLTQKLLAFRNVSDAIRDIAVYLDASGYYVTSQTTYTPAIAADMLRREQGLTDADAAYLRGMTSRGFYVLPLSDGQIMGRRMVYAAPLTLSANGQHRGTLIVTLQDRLFDPLPSGKDGAGDKAIFLTDNRSAVALSEIPAWLSEDFQPALLEPDGTVFKQGRNKLLVSSVRSQAMGGTYIILDRYDEMYRELWIIRAWALWGVLLCTAVGLGLSVYFMRRNYSPVQQLVASITGGLGLREQADMNEYHFLNEAVRTAVQTQRTAERQMTANARLLRRVHLTELLRGHEVPEADLSELSGELAVALYLVEDTGEFFGAEVPAAETRHEMLRFLLDNCSQDVFHGFASHHLLEMDRYFVQVLRFEEGDAA
ncbi:MAG TPA: hypothetical protein PKE04_13065, partial [Clostridia bacterium]|nr:hypothetical protein [Clostridia bacterium]